MNEYKIRDYFKENLSLIEKGLILVDDEFRVNNHFGTSGRIDILAKDQLDQYVVIEIKRSKCSSRQTIQELLKYIRLLRQTFSIPPHRIRCIVLSTHWSDLLAPFSELVSKVIYSIDGYQIEVEDSTPVLKDKIIPSCEPIELILSPYHGIYLYYDSEDCKKAYNAIKKLLESFPYLDIIVMKLKYEGSNERVVQHYALYVSVFNICSKEFDNFLNGSSHELSLFEDINSDWLIEQEVEMWLMKNIPMDDYEIGYPNKFSNLVFNLGWNIKEYCRFGNRILNNDLMSDEEIRDIVAGIKGENSIVFSSNSSPQFRNNWNQFKTSIQNSLEGNKQWQDGINLLLKDFEREHFEDIISVRIFNPMNILLLLYKYSKEGDNNCLPAFEIVVNSNENNSLRHFVGLMVWDCATFPVNPYQMITNNDYVSYMLCHNIWQKEMELINYHGFKYTILEVINWNTPMFEFQEYSVEEGKLIKEEFYFVNINSMKFFLNENQLYLDKLQSFIEAYTVGL